MVLNGARTSRPVVARVVQPEIPVVCPFLTGVCAVTYCNNEKRESVFGYEA